MGAHVLCLETPKSATSKQDSCGASSDRLLMQAEGCFMCIVGRTTFGSLLLWQFAPLAVCSFGSLLPLAWPFFHEKPDKELVAGNAFFRIPQGLSFCLKELGLPHFQFRWNGSKTGVARHPREKLHGFTSKRCRFYWWYTNLVPRSFGASCLDVRTLTFCQLMGFPLNHSKLNS